MKKGGGSHQRNTNLAIESFQKNSGNFKLCKCPLHYNDGKGTNVSADEFNRCSTSKDGLQAMCAVGKTQIDRFSHDLKRISTILAFYPEKLDYIFSDVLDICPSIVSKIKSLVNEKISVDIKNDDPNFIYLLEQLNIIFEGAYTIDQIFDKTIHNISILYRLQDLDKILKSEKVGLYTSKLSKFDLEKIDEDLKEKTNEIFNHTLKTDILDVAIGYYTIESKDNVTFYEADSCPVNFSKLNPLYDKNYNKTIFKLNIHNTKEKGQRASTNRAYSYLADGIFTEANRYMKKIGQNNKKIHADHMVALRLGGIHNVINLMPLSDGDNLRKKDRLLPEIFLMLKNNPELLSEYHRSKFLGWVKLNYNNILIEKLLKRSVEEQISIVKNMSTEDKTNFLKNKYPYLKNDKIERLIRKFF